VAGKATFYFAADDGRDPIHFDPEGKMKRKLVAFAKRALPVARLLYQNRKAEVALAAAIADAVSRALGH
jgi:hypothetical protein